MQKDDTTDDDLRQIRERQLAVLDEIDQIRSRDGESSADLDKIQRDALAIVHEIDSIQKRRDDSFHTQREMSPGTGSPSGTAFF